MALRSLWAVGEVGRHEDGGDNAQNGLTDSRAGESAETPEWTQRRSRVARAGRYGDHREEEWRRPRAGLGVEAQLLQALPYQSLDFHLSFSLRFLLFFLLSPLLTSYVLPVREPHFPAPSRRKQRECGRRPQASHYLGLIAHRPPHFQNRRRRARRPTGRAVVERRRARGPGLGRRHRCCRREVFSSQAGVTPHQIPSQ